MQGLQPGPGSGGGRPRPLFAPTGLVRAAFFAMAGALLGRELGILGVGLAGALALGGVRVGLSTAILALPAALGAVPRVHGTAPIDGLGSAPRLVRVSGVVDGPVLPDHARGRVRFWLRPVGGGLPLHCRASLQRGEESPTPGDSIRGPALLVTGRHGPTAEVVSGALSRTPAAAAAAWPTRVRLACEAALARHVRGEAGDVAAHLVLGRGPRLADDLVDAHRSTGLAHLLAVSGAHASMLAMMLAAGYAAARGRDPWMATGFRRTSAVLLLGYGAVTGFEPPVLRALAAWCVVAFAAAQGRRPSVAATLAVPALLTACWCPDDLLSISFALSYAAVIGLAIAGAFRRPASAWDRVRLAARASLFAMAATTPCTLAWFGQLSPWTLVGTPILAPLVTAMLALGVSTCALAALAPPLASVTGALLAFLTDGYAAAVRSFAVLPGAPVPALVVPSSLCLGAAVLAGLAWLCWRPTRAGFLTACALASVPHFVPGAGGVPDPRVVLAAVGHGQVAVAHLPDGHTVVVDCGSRIDPRRATDAAIRALAPRRSIDLLVVSHGDADHVGGVAALVRNVVLHRAILPEELRGGGLARSLAARGVDVTYLGPGQEVWAFDGAVHACAPRLAGASTRNDRSTWTEIRAADVRVVLPGDADAPAIRAMLRELEPGPVTALVLPHHGRGEREPIDALVTHLGPTICLASSGDVPDHAVRLRVQGTPVLSTAEHGDLIVHLAATDSPRHGLVEASVPARIQETLPHGTRPGRP